MMWKRLQPVWAMAVLTACLATWTVSAEADLKTKLPKGAPVVPTAQQERSVQLCEDEIFVDHPNDSIANDPDYVGRNVNPAVPVRGLLVHNSNFQSAMHFVMIRQQQPSVLFFVHGVAPGNAKIQVQETPQPAGIKGFYRKTYIVTVKKCDAQTRALRIPANFSIRELYRNLEHDDGFRDDTYRTSQKQPLFNNQGAMKTAQHLQFNDEAPEEYAEVQDGYDPQQQSTMATQPPTALTGDCQQQMTGYKAELSTLANKGWNPPRPPHHGEWTAKVVYNVQSTQQAIENVHIVKSSGNPAVDQSATDKINHMQSQLPPIPQCFTQPSLEVEHTFKLIYR
jgi:hypothetical protein